MEAVCGTLELKGWSKSFESWNAGGSDYYVLNLDEGEHLSAASGLSSVILRPTEDLPLEGIDAFKADADHACVLGEYQHAKPYVPSSPFEQYPIGLNGDPVPRGSGLRVNAIAGSRDALVLVNARSM
eukprot:CAMPEP_0119414298 /NCGR_PEP_ID=MMETSP1335-20130426/6780_1 /TAXON_ID=259385 /ORGANISM="Chrysoculter rhomboideus, Strain RCC1486" /LENGTH=126 /DNA_ID=CAMNT_0007439171 /DNA_START=31 /DNA_END=411 /DNA_ORIENTATION=+